MSSLRLIKLSPKADLSQLTVGKMFLIEVITNIRARYDYLIDITSIQPKYMIFKIRDARNTLFPGDSEVFMKEIEFMMGKKIGYIIANKGAKGETVKVWLNHENPDEF